MHQSSPRLGQVFNDLISRDSEELWFVLCSILTQHGTNWSLTLHVEHLYRIKLHWLTTETKPYIKFPNQIHHCLNFVFSKINSVNLKLTLKSNYFHLLLFAWINQKPTLGCKKWKVKWFSAQKLCFVDLFVARDCSCAEGVVFCFIFQIWPTLI